MENSSERVVGVIDVSADLAMGYEKLSLYFTDRRIIADHGSKVGAGSVAPTFMFGSIGNAVASLFSRKKGLRRRSRAKYPSPAKILAVDKANFSIVFEEIISVDLTKGIYKNSISLLSTTNKYDFTSRARFDDTQRLFVNALGDKVKVHRETEPSPHHREESDKPISHSRT